MAHICGDVYAQEFLPSFQVIIPVADIEDSRGGFVAVTPDGRRFMLHDVPNPDFPNSWAYLEDKLNLMSDDTPEPISGGTAPMGPV